MNANDIFLLRLNSLISNEASETRKTCIYSLFCDLGLFTLSDAIFILSQDDETRVVDIRGFGKAEKRSLCFRRRVLRS